MATVTNISSFLLTSIIYTKCLLRKQKHHRLYTSKHTDKDTDLDKLTFNEALQLREKHFSKNLSLSYKNTEPLMVIEVGMYLFYFLHVF